MPTPSDEQRANMEALLPLVYDELRRVAQHYFRNQPAGFTLRPTEMVNEACLHLMQHSQIEWQSAEHFRAIAARKIWQVVVDHLKKRHAQKRGGARRPGSSTTSRLGDEPTKGRGGRKPARGWQRVPLDSIAVEWRDGAVDLLDLAEALEELGAESRRLSDVVTLHWFGGLTYAEVAGCLGVSASTVEKDFRYALAWLSRKLEGAGGDVN